MENNNKLSSGKAWALFIIAMVVVFGLGLLTSALMERRAEVASIFNNRKAPFTGEKIHAQNEDFRTDFPREYDTWRQTLETNYDSKPLDVNNPNREGVVPQMYHNGNEATDVLSYRPNMVVLWAGYAFSWDYTTPRGHMHTVEDMTRTLRTGAPDTETTGSNQPGTCWTCKSPDVPRIMSEKGVAEYYKANWAMWGNEIANPLGCSDCHDPESMDLRISRPALIEAYQRQGRDITKATQQEMRSLVCGQCHVEYYFKNDPNTPEHDQYLTFPWDKGFTVEDAEAYYDETGYYDYIHALSKAPILKAQHPGFETSKQGIHGQRGVSCADCHMPYTSEGGVKFSDHHIVSPLANMERTCLTCHRESKEDLLKNVFERQHKVEEIRTRAEAELTKAHIEAKYAWDNGATEEQMRTALQFIRKGQWRWDYAVASHGSFFHAPQEITRILGRSVDYALQARLEIRKTLASLGHNEEVPMPDLSTKEKAQAYIGLDIAGKRAAKAKFLEEIVPKWQQDAKSNGKVADDAYLPTYKDDIKELSMN